MLTRQTVLAAAAYAMLLPASLLAQASRESRGPLAGAATAVLVDGGLGVGNDAQTRVHLNGFALAPATPLPAVISAPDLRAILASFGAPLGLDIDDISTGRDDVLVDANGFLDVPPSSWGVLSFSLRDGAVGQPGSRIASQVMEGSIGATLFSWILPGSNLPPQAVGVVERSHSRQELGLPAGTVEVDAVDFPLMLGLAQPVVTAGVGGPIVREPGFESGLNPLIEDPQAIYFTVSHATRGLVPGFWWVVSGVPTLSSGATIFRVLKSSPGGPWSPPQVACSYLTLGLMRDEDIDGLAYDEPRQKLLFSVVGTARDQLLFADIACDVIIPEPVKHPLPLPNGTPVSQLIGKAQNDDIDAVCTLDPVIGTIGGPPPGGDDFGSSVGTPRPGLLGVPSLGGSAYRRYQAGVVRFDTFMVGWPPVASAAPGFAVAFLTSGNNLDALLIGGIHLRNPLNVVLGDPQAESIVVPPALVLTGQRFTFRWFALDAATGELAEAWPMQVYL